MKNFNKMTEVQMNNVSGGLVWCLLGCLLVFASAMAASHVLTNFTYSQIK